MRSTILALVAALLVTTSPAFAGGGEKGDVELGVYGGFAWLDDYGYFHPKDHYPYGARLGYYISRHWGAELSAQRISTKTDFGDGAMIGVPDVDMKLDAIRLNVLYNFNSGAKFRPFLTGGVGREMVDVEDFGESCDTGWNAGAGFRWFMTPHWNLRADGRYVGTNVGGEVDESQGNVELTLGLGLSFGGGGTAAAEDVSMPAQNQRPTVSCASDRSEILPGESVSIHATASDPDGDPLTYKWSTTAGRLTGSGATVNFAFSDVTPPASATITVRVSDNRGNTESCNSVVSLREPVRAAEAVSCNSAGFARNITRLNNVDKACLDDVAQRLGADPRARVIVIGHTDSRESEAIAQRRADAVKDYLVQERGIEASRITTRSAAATRPQDTGTDAAAQSSNRRVEVWFVPEGAAEPR